MGRILVLRGCPIASHKPRAVRQGHLVPDHAPYRTPGNGRRRHRPWRLHAEQQLLPSIYQSTL